MKYRPEDVWVEVRKCPACHRTFKTHPNSKTIYDTRFCGDFDHGREPEPIRLGVRFEITVGVSTAKGPKGTRREIKFRTSGKRI